MASADPRETERSDELRELLRTHPFLAKIVEAASAHAEPFDVTSAKGCLDLHARNVTGGAPNRARIRVFRGTLPGGGGSREKWVAFFYKKSNLPWSRDRYSYGGVPFDPGALAPAQVEGWLRFAVSGLDPEKTPEGLKRALPYEVPE